MGHRQQGNAVFIVGHDARHALARRRAFGRIKFRLAGRNRFCILCLQQLGARRTATLAQGRSPESSSCRQQKGEPAGRQFDR